LALFFGWFLFFFRMGYFYIFFFLK